MKNTVLRLVLFLLLSAHVGALDLGLYIQDSVGGSVHIVNRDSSEYAGMYSPENDISFLLPTPGGVSVYALAAGNTLEVFSAETGQAEAQFANGWMDIAGFAFTPTGERFFVLDRGAESLFVYRHQRLTLEQSGSVDFPVGQSGDIAFNGRGTRYFALGDEGEGSLLISGDGLNGRILSRLELDFEAEHLVLSENDRFAWVAGPEQLAVIDLRKNTIIRNIRGGFNPKTLVLEARGKRALVLSSGGTELLVFNNQNGKKLLSTEIPSGYSRLLVDEKDIPWLIPDSTNEPFLRVTFMGNRSINAEAVDIRGLPAGLNITQAIMASVKRSGNFACF